MTQSNVPDSKSAVDKIAALYYRIEKIVALISLDSLPSVELTDGKVSATIPKNTSCVYFLIHQQQGLLYIGKALDLAHPVT